MNYLSIEFGLLFILFLCLYWSLAFSYRIQNGLLIVASYALVCTFNIEFALILFGYTVAVYFVAFLCVRYPQKRCVKAIIVIMVLGMLTIFKYYDFFQENMQSALAKTGIDLSIPVVDLLLPIGLSFYTFHSVSYLVSVRTKEIQPVSFGTLLLYLSFFPSLVAGPINRAKVFLPQIITTGCRQVVELPKAMLLLCLAIIKLFLLSAFLSDNYVNQVFASPSSYSAETVLTAVYAYAFQIYFNFSGYTDLVTAMAMLLGFQLPKNFNFPYLANNLKEFWSRWHISLSQFIRDYAYIPLGGSRRGFTRTQFNVLVAMTLSGLWHGAGLPFIFWGALHGVGLIIFNLKNRYLSFINGWYFPAWFARLLTFHYICFTWIFFRSATLSDAKEMLSTLAHFSPSAVLRGEHFSLLMFMLAIVAYPTFISCLKHAATLGKKIHWVLSPLLLSAFMWLAIVFSPSGIPEFIYASF